jgi:hypothetical protein
MTKFENNWGIHTGGLARKYPKPIGRRVTPSPFFQSAYAIFEPVWIHQLFSNLVIIHLLAYEDGTDSVPKCRHIKFRHRGITQKKTNNIIVVAFCIFLAGNFQAVVKLFGQNGFLCSETNSFRVFPPHSS